ncbi:DEAD/DEAH box helicase family protein [Pontibacterium granulatum]|uniref:DEAD/DEAH box helicase family protein n=1 Tax=Pontibacterium granulatum TaxID=2036029 RepID=UPI00249A220B|nr:DEAD/DEAH box helicase family protein [Pontibacterium granulatum]MDI3323391.1 DEAD/DEAH box helicase family protein [Pontibacterium granulatum]
MKSMNFEHLRNNWPALADLGAYAETYACTDPQSALVKLRCFVEKLVGEIYKDLKLPIQPNSTFMDRLNNNGFTSVVPRVILDKLHAVRIHGNKAAHEGDVSVSTAVWLVEEAYYLGCWLFVAQGEGSRETCPDYQAPKLDSSGGAKAEFKKKNKALQEKLASQSAQLEVALKELEDAKHSALEAQQQAAKLKVQIDEAKAQRFSEGSKKATQTLNFNEAETRRRLIDSELRLAGWDIAADGSDTEQVTLEHEVDGQPTKSGIGYCDYVLWDDNGKPLAVVEAKRARENPEKGRQQAKLYADALEKKHQQRPVIFYTNGYDIWLWDDVLDTVPRKLYGYYSKDSLQYLIGQRQLRKELNSTTIDTNIAGRLYQMESITRVSERFSDGHRKALIVQATGTGKTRVSIALTKRLLDAGWAKRVLFLCDRKELRKQAKNAYSEFVKEPLYVVGRSKKEDQHNARIYIATYPGMMGIYEQFDVGYFDLIIADESHRSVYNVFGDLFKYFDARQVGLTATPVEMVSRSTCKLFGCDYKMPTANYPLEQAVEEGNLVPFKVVTHTTQFLREGIKGHTLSDEQIAELEDQGFDPNEMDFDVPDVDKAVFNKDTNRAILRNLMERGLRDVDGQLPGKSIVFARSIQHAELLAELFGEMYPQHGGNFCRVIHSKYERAEELIDDFKKTDGSADQITIAVSVDMLDTGIDVPEVVNLVFAKPVKSKVKFWQMVGRGTRLCEHLYGTGNHKTHFLIFDHWANFDYFEMDPPEDDGRTGKSLCEKLFETRIELAETALQKAEMELFKQVIALVREDIDALDDRCIAVRDKWQLKAQLSDAKQLDQFAPDTRHLLRAEMAPLMQWRDIRGEAEALRWDQQITELQQILLTKPSQMDVAKLAVLTKVAQLSMHLNPVRAKAGDIKEIQQDAFWQSLTFDALEQKRMALRGIIHLRDKGSLPPAEPLPVIDIKEDQGGYHIAERPTTIVTVDYQIFRQEVEQTLAPLFDTDPVLQKIRNGEPVSDAELQQLNALVHVQNPNLDLDTLTEFFPESGASLDQMLRTLIGMDAKAVESAFTEFVQSHHINLNAQQQRFIALLKNHLCKYGTINVAQLYDPPFTAVHHDGLDGIFNREEQADALVALVKQFGVELGQRRESTTRTIDR